MLGFGVWKLLDTLKFRHSGEGRNPVLPIFKHVEGLGPGLSMETPFGAPGQRGFQKLRFPFVAPSAPANFNNAAICCGNDFNS